MKRNWWLIAAGLVAAFNVVFAVGNIIDPDDGPLWGKIVLLGVMVAGLGAIVTGLALRRRGRVSGSWLIAIGVLPAAPALFLFWFPPAVLYGALAIATAVAATMDAARFAPATAT